MQEIENQQAQVDVASEASPDKSHPLWWVYWLGILVGLGYLVYQGNYYWLLLGVALLFEAYQLQQGITQKKPDQAGISYSGLSGFR